MTMWGIYNVLLNGTTLGGIVFIGNKIYCVYAGAGLHEDCTEWVNGKECEAYPAGIDIHVHDRWGEPEKETPETLIASCHEGGVATVCGMGNTKPPYVFAHQTEARFAGFAGKPLNFFGWMACTRDNKKERQETRTHQKDKVIGGKLMMASTNNPESLVDDEPSQMQILEENASLGITTAVHAEAEDLLNRSRAQYEQLFNPLRVEHHCLVRSGPVEVVGVTRILDLHHTVAPASPLHICHIASNGSVEAIMRAKDRGQNVTFETGPHYWSFDENWLQGENGGLFKMNPALRTLEDKDAIFRFLCEGTVDVMATDHAPHERGKKRNYNLDSCPSGLPGVQWALLLVYQLMRQGYITKQQFIGLTSEKAAKILGLKKGALKPEFDADVVLIDPSQDTYFSDETTHSKAGYNPYRLTTINGRITGLVIAGTMVKNHLT